jgi:hypothetical protein
MYRTSAIQFSSTAHPHFSHGMSLHENEISTRIQIQSALFGWPFSTDCAVDLVECITWIITREWVTQGLQWHLSSALTSKIQTQQLPTSFLTYFSSFPLVRNPETRCEKCFIQLLNHFRNCISILAKTLCYKPESRWFETRWNQYFFLKLPNPTSLTRPWGSLIL